MEDRELLEMAAKAAGLNYKVTEDHVRLLVRGSDNLQRPWDPLSDDGDAFRLALKLQIKIEYVPEMDSVMCSLPGSMGATSVAAIGDVELRYAIVQAAAQLGLTL